MVPGKAVAKGLLVQAAMHTLGDFHKSPVQGVAQSLAWMPLLIPGDATPASILNDCSIYP